MRAGIFASAVASEPIIGDIDSVTELYRRNQRTSALPPYTEPTITFAGAYASDRWLVGLAMIMDAVAYPVITVDGVTPVTLILDAVPNSTSPHEKYLWYVAQPTGSTCSVVRDYPGFAGTNVMNQMYWEVRSASQPELVDSVAAWYGVGSVNSVADGAGMAVGAQTSATDPSGDFNMTNIGSAAGGWYSHGGMIFPTSGSALSVTPVNNGASAITIA